MRTCTVCASPKRTEIDSRLLKAEPLRSIVEHCGVSMGALVRHKDKHLPVSVAHAKAAREIAAGENLIEQAQSLRGRALGILAKAEAAGQLETALKAIREVRGILELLGKLDGQIQERATTVQHIEVHYVDKQLIANSPATQAAIEAPTPAFPDAEHEQGTRTESA